MIYQVTQTNTSKKAKRMLLIMILTAAAITASGILCGQAAVRMLPLYVSLVIALLQSRVSRLAPLIGGINALLYSAVYAFYRLYASAAYALLVSCPLQIVTFILWSRHPWDGSTMLKRMSLKRRLLLAAAGAAAWIAICLALSGTKASHSLLDTGITVSGIIATILMMLSYIEYTIMMLAGQLLSICLYIAMLADSPEQTPYLIYSVYSLICSAAACVNAHKIFSAQQSAETSKTSNSKGGITQ